MSTESISSSKKFEQFRKAVHAKARANIDVNELKGFQAIKRRRHLQEIMQPRNHDRLVDIETVYHKEKLAFMQSQKRLNNKRKERDIAPPKSKQGLSKRKRNEDPYIPARDMRNRYKFSGHKR